MPTTTDLLDLAPNVGQRSSTIRWDVLDRTLTKIGTVTPDAQPAARVTLNIAQAIKRTLTGVMLSAGVQEEVDPFGQRLRPVWVLENGAEFPLGVFIFGSMDRIRDEWGLDARVTAVDQTIIVDQAIVYSVGLAAGDDIRAAILQQLATANVPVYDVDTRIVEQVATPILWPSGTSRLKIVNELAAMAGAFSLYFDNAGTGRIEVIPDETSGPADHEYRAGGRMLPGMVESDDLLQAPNRFLVIDTSNREAPVTGVYDVPDDAPHSFANRGFHVVEVIEEQGLTSNAAATARAYAAFVEAQGGYQWVQFSSAPDPRHDVFDTVDYLGVRYRERGWTLPLIEGGEMTHDLRRVYAL